MPKHLFFFVGKPGSGKETQGRLLAEKLGYEVFMTGAKYREIIASGSFLGNRIKDHYDKGFLMPAWVSDYFFEDFVFKLPPEKGAVFEGAARDVEQAQTIEKVTNWLGRGYTVFNLEVTDDEVVRRSLARGRDAIDASESAIRNRLMEYAKSTHPAIQYFHSIRNCIEINGEQPPEKVHDEVMKAVADILK
jgi:adenylate kinase